MTLSFTTPRRFDRRTEEAMLLRRLFAWIWMILGLVGFFRALLG
jgi:hypothetical protein